MFGASAANGGPFGRGAGGQAGVDAELTNCAAADPTRPPLPPPAPPVDPTTPDRDVVAGICDEQGTLGRGDADGGVTTVESQASVFTIPKGG